MAFPKYLDQISVNKERLTPLQVVFAKVSHDNGTRYDFFNEDDRESLYDHNYMMLKKDIKQSWTDFTYVNSLLEISKFAKVVLRYTGLASRVFHPKLVLLYNHPNCVFILEKLIGPITREVLDDIRKFKTLDVNSLDIIPIKCLRTMISAI
ncbi:unnamed protein product [Ambrosiozyma monospora]|uniref:Unnamed protein product n=1 Tax=Ambrosiozyma monospora TaxID=43982 RepID=A0ACB5SSG8_AMBMO|nr:unnamed protein product [Ambrosiozyma monospora]